MTSNNFMIDPTEQLNAFTKQYQEGVRTYLNFVGTMADSLDKQVADGLRVAGSVQDHLAASRRQGIKMFEEAVERSLGMSQTLVTNMTQAWRTK
ncbi:MAG: hypothetical protein AB2A00_33785 [Myxococcota bacterium]